MIIMLWSCQSFAECNECCKKGLIKQFINESIKIGRDGDLDGSLVILEKALELEEDNAKTLSIIGGAYFAKNDLNKAIEYCIRAIEAEKVKPILSLYEYSGLYASIGLAYAKLNDDNKAIKYYTDSMDIDPTQTWNYLFRARAFVNNGDLKKALIDYESLMELDNTKKAEIIKELANLYIELENLENAIEAVKSANELEVELDDQFYKKLEKLEKNHVDLK